MSQSELLEYARTAMMARPPTTPEEVEALVRRMSLALIEPVSDEVIKQVAQQLEREFSVSLGKSHLITSKHEPWLRAKAHEIDFRYWRRYKQFLLNQGFGGPVVNAISDVTDEILDLAGDPEAEGEWSRRGLVVGHVQSGKTANYVGLINKAADAGYKLIVLIAGIHSNLRSQTQERIDQGFVGRDSDQVLSKQANAQLIGVGDINDSFSSVAYTSRALDFARNRADGLGIPIQGLKEPAIFVIKKNPSILKNLIEWLQGTTAKDGKLAMPMLVIDDEADNASVNIAKDPSRPNTINRQVRELLGLSGRNTYIGYTATPFANIFIDPDSNHEVLGNDLFPRNFIVGLDAPSNYVGAREFFLDDEDERLTVDLDDTDEWLETTHKIDRRVEDLHYTLEEAMDCFVVSKAIRILRGQGNKHHSMLVNVSRFTRVQGEVARELTTRLHLLKDAIENRYASPVGAALRDPMIASLHASWEKHYSDEPETWPDIQKVLHQAAAGMLVEQINASRASGKLDYRAHEGTGLNVIAVGGNSLSRGFTLEGLTISYFLRNTQMYDTLLQMGRWFGYRDGYGSLCRLFLKPEARDWYAFISQASEELRNEIRKMEAAGLTPEDFGLAVRSHPDSLLVTARNKMVATEQIVREVGLANKLVESAVLHAEDSPREFNLALTEKLVTEISSAGYDRTLLGRQGGSPSVLFRKVHLDQIASFISSFSMHFSNVSMQPGPLIEYANKRAFQEWDVVVVSNSSAPHANRFPIGNIEVGLQVRKMIRHKRALQVSGTKLRVASRGVEKAGLTDGELLAAEIAHQEARREGEAGEMISDRFYREQRSRPLLMLHFLLAENEKDVEVAGKKHAAYGISFPALRPGEKEEEVVYTANLIAFRQHYGDLDASGDEEDELEEV